jgi:hypothetical protein
MALQSQLITIDFKSDSRLTHKWIIEAINIRLATATRTTLFLRL